MIKYEIIVKHTRDQKVGRDVVKPEDPHFKQVVLQRNLAHCWLKENDRVKIRKQHMRGTIIKVEKDINQINWYKNKPHFVQVRFDNGQNLMCHPSQLKKAK